VHVYIDTSMLVKRYLPELGSEELESRLLAEQPHLSVGEIVHPEITSALRRKRRQGQIDDSYFQSALDRFHQDLHRGAIQVAPMERVCFQRAADLLRGLRAPLATLDALHLSCALELGCDIMFTSDAQLARAAHEAGLACWPEYSVI
jgi:predicted nucleic acid-binding protein